MIKIKNNNPIHVLLATSNQGKLLELQSLLGSLPLRCILPGEINLHINVEETGSTYAENAQIKALAYQRASGMTVLADDTGLEVEALRGAPGIHSARFSPLSSASDADRRALLLDKLGDFPQPWRAAFKCVVAIAAPGKEIHLFDGAVEGEIIAEERGAGGFGYDKLFWIPAAGKTMSELGIEEKNCISHRAIAVKKSIPYLLNVFNVKV